jgi:plastocyanin
MRKALIVGAAVALLAAGSAALAGSAGIKITSAGFTPADVSIQSGDSVNWTNSDAVRHEVAVNGTSCKLSLEPAQSSSCTFPSPGTFPYNDPTASGSGFHGTVSVAANSRSVTLASSRKVGIFGDAMALSGTVSSKAAGQHVTVTAKPATGPAYSYDVVTAANGTWTLQVQPRARTTYQATWDTATSSPLTVDLRPRLTFQKVGRHQYLVVVLAAHSMAGKRLDIARRIGGRYVVYRHATITSIARTSTTSVAYFVTFVRPGTHLRAFLPKSQVGAEYLDGHSNFVVQ